MPTRLLACLAVVATLTAAPVEVLPPELLGAVQPQVAVAPTGRIRLVFGKDNAVFYRTSLDGRAFSAPVKVGELEKLALRMRRGPRVTVTDRLVLVTAISPTDGNLHSWTSGDTGRSWTETAPLNTVPNSAREAPVRFAENAAAASIVSGPEMAVVAWEGDVSGAKTILLDRVR